MDIGQIAPDDVDAVAGLLDVHNAAQRIDCPDALTETLVSYRGYLRHGWDGERPVVLASRRDGRIVGSALLTLSEWDNTHLGWLSLAVHPEFRRSGYGTALLEAAEAHVRAAGRRSMGAAGWDTPQAVAFAAAHGYEQKSVEVNRRQHLRKVDKQVVDELHAGALAAAHDYDLLYVDGHTPADLLPAVAEMTAAINDAPTDDLDIEDEVYPVERIVGYETATAARGLRHYRVIARHRETGELAGHTAAAVEVERPHVCWQMDTSVVRSHRGHRLGLLLKSDMMRRLDEVEPQVEIIDTWNAESNGHMIGVNERLGYRIVGRTLDFQRELS